MKIKKTSPGVKLLCILMFNLLAFMTDGIASSLQVNMHGPTVEVRADHMPLIDILKVLTDKAKIEFKYSDPLSEIVSLDVKGISVEESLRRLLGDKNYTLTFKKNDNNQFVPTNLEVFGAGALATAYMTHGVAPQIENTPPPPQSEPMKRYEKAYFKQLFSDTGKLIKQISATPASDIDSGPENKGVRVRDISEGSAFNQIGIKKGDIVSDVNGRSIGNVDELIEAMQGFSKEQTATTIRIERLNSSQMLDPIYIELH